MILHTYCEVFAGFRISAIGYGMWLVIVIGEKSGLCVI